MKSIYLALVLCVLVVVNVTADLPIHCLNVQVAGTWMFSTTEMNQDKEKATCGYERPDRNAQHFSTSFSFVPTKTFKVTLGHPNIATLEDGTTGTWTMIFDEGFEVAVGGHKYFAYNEYNPRPFVSFATSDQMGDYISNCGATRVGWYHTDDNVSWGCYKGEKLDEVAGSGVSSSTPTSSPTIPVVSPIAALQETSTKKADTAVVPKPAKAVSGASARLGSLTNKKGAKQAVVAPLASVAMTSHGPVSPMPLKTSVSAMPAISDDAKFDPTALIELVNSDAASTWSATVHKQFEGMRIKDLLKLAGGRSFKKEKVVRAQLDNRPDEIKYKEAGIPEDLWKGLDWRNYKGVNYDSPIKNQGSCGSCYAVAAVSAYEARFRVATANRLQPILSAQDLLSCSEYNQGCEGGYPFLVSKHGEEWGLREEKDVQYMASDIPCGSSTQGSRYFLKNHRYVGGFYGACKEALMMRELLNGPIMVAFEAPNSLFTYNNGIFTGPSPAAVDEGPEAKVNPWEHTNHAVVAVGWGTDETQMGSDGKPLKYWIIKNTWGDYWGEGGYFRIRRGTDECAIESMAVTADVVVPSSFIDLTETDTKAPVPSKSASKASLAELQAEPAVTSPVLTQPTIVDALPQDDGSITWL